MAEEYLDIDGFEHFWERLKPKLALLASKQELVSAINDYNPDMSKAADVLGITHGGTGAYYLGGALNNLHALEKKIITTEDYDYSVPYSLFPELIPLGGHDAPYFVYMPGTATSIFTDGQYTGEFAGIMKFTNTSPTEQYIYDDFDFFGVSGWEHFIVGHTTGRITISTSVFEVFCDVAEAGGGSVTGVKGDAESSYRTGNVNLTAANVGAVSTADIANNLTTTYGGKVLDARQGKALKDSIDDLENADDVLKNALNFAWTTGQAIIRNKVDKESGKGLSTNDYTNAEKTKLAEIEAGAQVNAVTGVKGNNESEYRTGNVNITKGNIGLGNVNNTSDANKPISTAQQAAFDSVDRDAMIDRTAFNYAYMLIQAELRDVQKRLETVETQIAALGS